MKKALFAMFLVCLVIFSCKKHHDDAVQPANQPYMNTNQGTNWVYETRTPTDTTYDTSHVSSPDTTINSKTYTVIAHNDGTHSYYNKTGNDYYQFQHFALAGVVDTSIEALYLKDNLAVGGTWSQNIDLNIGFPITVTLNYSISTETGTPKIVNGVTYPDVIVVKTEIQTPPIPGLTITSDIRNYYARNVGLIEGDYNIDVTGPASQSVHTQTLIKFSDLH